MLWIVLAGLVLAILAYVFARPYLLRIPAWAALCGWIDPLVVSWLSKSRTIAVARFYQLAGWLVMADAFVRPLLVDSGLLSVDWVSILNIQDPWGKLIGPTLTATGMLFSALRKCTGEPVAAKE